MPLWVHIPLVILITAYFLFRFIKDKQIYELLFVIWAPITLLTYVSTDPVFVKVVGIIQVVLFILVIFFMFKRRGYRQKKTAEILAKFSSGNLDEELDKKEDEIVEIKEENKE